MSAAGPGSATVVGEFSFVFMGEVVNGPQLLPKKLRKILDTLFSLGQDHMLEYRAWTHDTEVLSRRDT